MISIHAPTRGATEIIYKPRAVINYFNPRSHEGSDDIVESTSFTLLISIHAPTRGATCFISYSPFFISISIHAPTRGATKLNITSKGGSGDFNPRSHEGSDQGGDNYAWTFNNFNPRSHEGSDPADSMLSIASTVFQSTLPRGERPGFSSVSKIPSSFQSTLPRGERHLLSLQFLLTFCISIHAPTRGAT